MQLQNLPLKSTLPNAERLAAWEKTDTSEVRRSLADPSEPSSCPILAINEDLSATVFACWTHAPFLKDLLRRHHGFIAEVASLDPTNVIAAEIEALDTVFSSQLALRHALRHARQRLMLYLALGDCAGTLPLSTLTTALSQLADSALTAALGFELAQLAQRGDFQAECATPNRCGLAILGLGKLGGHELNYSSDIDLMIFFDPDVFAYEGRKEKKVAAVSLARAVCGHISAVTSDGFVFRVDLRLRPDPGSTPIAMTLDAAETYYQSIGQTWERAALIKARHSAGDLRIASDFLERIRPFVWRRHLDYAAIDDVHAMKKRVHTHHQHGESDNPGPGFDVKLGYGGIREIEFFAQIHQLIMGGKRPDLQIRPTCDVLKALTAEGDISAEDCAALIAAYEALRKAEHALQMIEDAQTHRFPEQAEAAESLAQFMGVTNAATLYAALAEHCSNVQTLFGSLLESETAQTAETPHVFEGSARLAETQQRWQSGTYRALRSQRAMQLLGDVKAGILAAFAKTPDPEETLIAFDTFLSQLPAGVQLFSLLNANRALITLLASIMGHAPELRTQIGRKASLFEGLLSGDLQDLKPGQTALRADLDTALARTQDYESVLDVMRIWNGEARFRTGVQLLEGLISPLDAMQCYSDIAEVSISCLYGHVENAFSQAHGTVEGGSFAAIALGSFGASELGTSSDLDLTFIYDVPAGQNTSNGAKPLSVREYYTRFAQRFITAITSMTAEGRLYEVDMRLRPSGRSGIIAVSTEAFEDYHQNKAWLWERMSLTKARAIAGTGDLLRTFGEVRSRILTQPLTQGEVSAAAWDMRDRLAKAAGTKQTPWSLKGGNGGLTDADFLAEALVLTHANTLSQQPKFACWQDWWKSLADAGVIHKPAVDDVPAARDTLLQARIAKKLLLPKDASMDTAPKAAQMKLAALVGDRDIQATENRLAKARKVIWGSLNDLLPRT